MTAICVPITEPTTETAIAAIRSLPPEADIIELRLDYMRDPDLTRLLESRDRPVICTCRAQQAGGRFPGGESERLAVLQEACRLGADYVDLEVEAVGGFRRSGNTGLIVSYHNFTETPADVESVYDRIARLDADVVKLATMALEITDNVRLLRLLDRGDRPAIALCMGELGLTSRILAGKFGSFLTFASSDAGKESAPGQITVRQLLDLYRFRHIGRQTSVYGVVADPVAHSMSPTIHNAAFGKLGVDAVYLPLRVKNLEGFLPSFAQIGAKGYSVTIPHKQAIIRYMDEVDATVREIGAMNTVVERDGRLIGYNTDLDAALDSLCGAVVKAGLAEDRAGALNGRKVLLLGAGGAARILAHGIVRAGARLTVANRTQSRAEKLADDIGCQWAPLAEAPGVEHEVLVNGTSVGMYPEVDQTPFPPEALRPGTVVFDDVYNPIETRLLKSARERGCVTVSGFEWFVAQAAMQFEIWTGRDAPRQLMADVVRRRLSEAQE